MANTADGFEKTLSLLQIRTTRWWRLKRFQLGQRMIGLIYNRIKPRGVEVEINHSPVKRDEEQDDEPDRNGGRTSADLAARGDRSRLDRSAHFGRELVGVAFVAAAPGDGAALV